MIERLLLAEGALARDELDAAERQFGLVADADPRNAIAVVGLARVALRRGDPEAARALATRALDIDPDEAAAARLLTELDREAAGVISGGLPRACRACRGHSGARLRRRTPRRRWRRTPRLSRRGHGGAAGSTACVAAADPGYASTMRILITGGAGYVGSVSLEALVDAGHEVVVLDSGVSDNPSSDLRGAPRVRGSYADRALVADLLASHRIDAVLHCAARSLVGQSMEQPALYFEENVAGGIALLGAMRDAGVNRLVISSTASVYGQPDASPISEDAPLRPINVYGETKRTLEAAAGWYARAYGLRVAALRYFNVAGASARNGEVHDPETHLIPNALKAVLGGPKLNIWGDGYPTPDGTPIRDYLHVVDLGDAHRLALEATAPGDERTDAMLICNLGSGRGFSVREVIAAIERVIGQARPAGRRPAPRGRPAGARGRHRPGPRPPRAGHPPARRSTR